MLRHCGVYCLTDNQSLEEQSTRTQIHTHIHIPHTLLETDSLIHCCHGNPIKGGHSGCNSGEISLSLFCPSLPFFHTHTPFFSFTASHFYLSPSITFCSSPIVLLLLSLHHPWCTSLPVSLHYCATFSSPHLPPPTSQANVNMSSHFTNPHHVYVSDFCLVSIYRFKGPLSLSLYVSLPPSFFLPSILRDTEYICD